MTEQQATSAVPPLNPTIADQVENAGGQGVPLVVNPANDLVAKEGTAQDSWFVINHLESGDDTFELLIHYILLTKHNGDSFLQTIVSVIDPVTGKYVAEEFYNPASAGSLSKTSVDLVFPQGVIEGTPEDLHVTANFTRIKADLKLSHSGPILPNVGSGLLPFYGDINYHYAMPSMKVSGTLSIDGKEYQCTGTTWFDRQWGQMKPRFFEVYKWTWFGMSLDDGTRISIWDIVDEDRDRAFATILHPNGQTELADVELLSKTASDFWKSEVTGRRYATKWTVNMPTIDSKLEIVSQLTDQEVVSSPPQNSHKYEGICSVTGTLHGKPVTGRTLAEVCGGWF